jgi:hypothetical protein
MPANKTRQHNFKKIGGLFFPHKAKLFCVKFPTITNQR